MKRGEAESVVDWLVKKSTEIPYGDLTITVKLHDGRPSLIERNYTERIKATGQTGDDHGERNS